jgi:hypothetical protein
MGAAVRARHVKSRRGCKSCRIRHVKCDETFPRCKNCTSTSRVCEGVAQSSFTFVTTPPRSESPPTQHVLSLSRPEDDDQRSLSFFLVKVAPVFQDGYLDSGFWGTLIPQLSQNHPVVSDVMISIALLFEHPLRIEAIGLDVVNQGLNQYQLKALQRYSRAVSRVAHRQDFSADDEVTALLTCVLFAALEFQTGNEGQAMALQERGIELLFNYLQNPSRSETTAESKALAEIVIPFFSRHAIFMATMGLPLMHGWSSTLRSEPGMSPDHSPFNQVAQLVKQLRSLNYRAHFLIRAIMLIVHKPEELENLHMFSRQQTLLSAFQQWHADLLSMDIKDQTIRQWVLTNLLMYYHASYTWLSCCLFVKQEGFDQYILVFQQIIYCASEVCRANGDVIWGLKTEQHLGFDGACIPPLVFTATKCRDPVIRRTALQIIRQSLEGSTFWSRIPTCEMLETIIAFEEETPLFLSTPASIRLPPEHRRVHHAQLLPQRNLIRLFTYQDGHASEPEHIEIHDVPLSSPELDRKLPGATISHSGGLWFNQAIPQT